jgi:GAF domain-containing protein
VKRRSKASGKPVKTRGRKAAIPKRRNAPKSARGRAPSIADLQEQLERRTRERDEALEQQAATSEVLRVINSSPGELEPVFQAILENATRISEAKFGNLWLREGDKFRIVAIYGGSPEYCERLFAQPLVVLDAQSVVGRVATNREVVQVADITGAPTTQANIWRVATIELMGTRTLIGVPMLGEGEVIGCIVIYRQEVRPFTDKQIELLKNFANQAVIAIENVRLLNELRQSLEQQTATSEVLQVISGSAGDIKRVFATILEKAVRYCDGNFGTLFLHKEDQFSLVAAYNMPTAFSEAHRDRPGIVPGGPVETVMRTRRTVHMPDLAAIQSYLERHPRAVDAVELGGVRTIVAVPMIRDDEPIGVIAIHRPEVRPFTDKQIDLLTNFAAKRSSPSRIRGYSMNCVSARMHRAHR